MCLKDVELQHILWSLLQMGQEALMGGGYSVSNRLISIEKAINTPSSQYNFGGRGEKKRSNI